jgi:serine/threonine protein kinase
VSGPKICPQCGAEYELDQRFCPQDGTTLRLQNASGDLLGTIVADRYHVLRKLGEGGMGQVYLAEHVKMGRKSALKVMNPSMVKDADAISRFNREASNASRINHPHVADVYDFGETADGIIYLAMEFVDGPPLTKLIEQEGPLAATRVANIVRQAADALAVAHEMGIVHRDLKPDNIMIARNRDGSDCAKVVDFGIAKAADNAAQKVTKTGLVVGTPEYMSPEQLAGDKLDGRSDIYALALVAFNMLTGKLPFPAETVQESMIMRLTEPPRKLAEMSPQVSWSSDVQEVLDKALERDVSARFKSANEFGRALSGALERMSGDTQGIRRVAGAAPAVKQPSSLPPTRVREPAAASQRESAPSSTLPLAPPIGRRTHAVAYGTGGVILAAALAASAVVLSRKNDKPLTPATDSVTPTGRATSQGKSADTARYAQGVDSSRPGASGAVPSRNETVATSAVDVSARLDSLEKVVSGDVTPNEAARVIRELEQMKSRIKGNEQVVHAAIVDALAESSRRNKRAACAALRRVRPIAPETTRARDVSIMLSQAC